jgi:repressor LexA
MADTAEPTAQPDPGLTREQIAILVAIRSLTRDHDGRPPSMREVAAALDRKSAGGLAYQYRILEAAGCLRRDPGSVRSVQVRLPGEPPFLAPPGEPPFLAPPGEPALAAPSGEPALPAQPGEPARAAQPGEAAPLPAPGPETSGIPAGPGLGTVVWVPIAGQVAAGVPISPAEPREDRLPLPREVVGGGTLFALRVVGDSMIGVGIVDGDWVVIREQAEAENGEVVAALIDGVEVEGTVKTLKLADGHRWLMPQNPAYTPILGDKAEIRGKVVAVLRSA